MSRGVQREGKEGCGEPGQHQSVLGVSEDVSKVFDLKRPRDEQQNLTDTHSGAGEGPARLSVAVVPTLHPRRVGRVRNPPGEGTVLLVRPVVAKRKQTTKSQQWTLPVMRPQAVP